MSQRDTLRAMDAAFHAAFQSAGLADTVVHTPVSTGTPINRRAYVDRVVAVMGGEGQVRSAGAAITLLRADGPDPIGGDTLAIDGETYTVDRVEVDDESRIVCTVTLDG
jgi:hypothetical protein